MNMSNATEPLRLSPANRSANAAAVARQSARSQANTVAGSCIRCGRTVEVGQGAATRTNSVQHFLSSQHVDGVDVQFCVTRDGTVAAGVEILHEDPEAGIFFTPDGETEGW